MRATSRCTRLSGGPKQNGIETSVAIVFETDGSTRNHPEGKPTNTVYALHRSVTTVAKNPSKQRRAGLSAHQRRERTFADPRAGRIMGFVYDAGVDTVIEELLPSKLQDFFVMDADEAADFVGGSENKVIERRAVIAKTTFAVSALLGLEVFESAPRVACKRSPRSLVGRRQRRPVAKS